MMCGILTSWKVGSFDPCDVLEFALEYNLTALGVGNETMPEDKEHIKLFNIFRNR